MKECRDRMRGKSSKLKEDRVRFDIRKKCFTVRVVRHLSFTGPFPSV